MYKLPAAHYFVYENGKMDVRRFWDCEFDPQPQNFEACADKLDEVVHESVAAHRIADVKVGSFLSGGVDSAVAAHLLRESGLEVYGLYLDNGLPGADAAREAAASLSVPLTIADSREAMEQYVCTPFAEAYLRGETPNPCILCNPAVKFRALLDEAERIGAKYIATGHYARAENGAIYRGQPENDQSYMLCRLTPDEVNALLLPLAPYKNCLLYTSDAADEL